MSRPRDDLGLWLLSLGFAPEVPFRGLNGKRRFRWDWLHEASRTAVEYDGMGVGHQSIRGTWRDAEKANEAQLCGILLIRCSVKSVEDGRCQDWIERALRRAA